MCDSLKLPIALVIIFFSFFNFQIIRIIQKVIRCPIHLEIVHKSSITFLCLDILTDSVWMFELGLSM